MTIFAVVCAGISRAFTSAASWFAYWLFPIPNQMAMWPNFFSPLLWDVFAVSTYATVSVLFWYMGMVPDLATFRDRATTKIRILCLWPARRWAGAARTATGMCMNGRICFWPALATPLVLSVH